MMVVMMMRQTTAKSNISSSTIAFVCIDNGGVFFTIMMIDDGCYDDKMMRQTTAKSNISSSARANQVWAPRSQFRDPPKIHKFIS